MAPYTLPGPRDASTTYTKALCSSALLGQRNLKRIAIATLVAATALYLFIASDVGAIYSRMREWRDVQGLANGYHLSSSKGIASNSVAVDRNPHRSPKPRAAFMALVREKELQDLLASLRDIQWVFNDDLEHGYDFVFLSEQPFSPYFKDKVDAFLAGRPSQPKAQYGLVSKEDWDIPAHIDMAKAKQRWKKMKDGGYIPYAGSKSYRQMCRYMSGPIFHHPLLADLDYYWRLEPNTRHTCTYSSHWKVDAQGRRTWVERDPFRFMRDNNKKYAWNIIMTEFRGTVMSLMGHVNAWKKENPSLIQANNSFAFVSDDGQGYNMCHFWTNYEIIDLSFTRSSAYSSYFASLDKAGGFFYERWGDAPVRSIAAAMLLNRDEIWQVDYAGYSHPPFSYCPRRQDPGQTCVCDADMNIEYAQVCLGCKTKLDKVNGFDSKAYIEDINTQNGFPGIFKEHEVGYIVGPPRMALPV